MIPSIEVALSFFAVFVRWLKFQLIEVNCLELNIRRESSPCEIKLNLELKTIERIDETIDELN